MASSSILRSSPLVRVSTLPSREIKRDDEIEKMTKSNTEQEIGWSSTITDINQQNVLTTPFSSPEIAILLHFLVDEPVDLSVKLNATKMLIDARVLESSSSTTTTTMNDIYRTTYFELLLGAISVYATVVNTPKGLGGSELYCTVWQSALCGLLPWMIGKIEEERKSKDSSHNNNDVEIVLKTLFERAQTTLEQCEAQYKSPNNNSNKQDNSKSNGTDGADMDAIMMESLIEDDETSADSSKRNPVRAAFIQSFVDRNLIDLEKWQAGKTILEEAQMDLKPCLIINDAKQSSMSVKEYVLQQFINGGSSEDSWLAERIVEDYSVQESVNVGLLEKMMAWTNENDIESLSKVSSFLLSNDTALHVWLFYVSATNALQPVSTLFDHPDSLQSGEDPSVLAPIILLGQYIVQIGLNSGASLDQLCPPTLYKFFPSVIRSLTSVKPLDHLSDSEQETVSNWILALFGSEGISDDLIRSSSPQLLLRTIPTIFSQAINATVFGVIDGETLRGGLTYFLQDLLNYTLPGALRAATNEIERSNQILQTSQNNLIQAGMNVKDVENLKKTKEVCLEVLMNILQEESCPQTVKKLVCQQIITVLEQQQNQSNANNNINTTTTPPSDQIDNLILSFLPFSQSQNQFKRTDIWIKLASSSTSPSGLDPLLNMSASLYSIITQRGIEAVINLIKKSVRFDNNPSPENQQEQQRSILPSIQKSIGFSLGLINLREIVENLRISSADRKFSLVDQKSIKVISSLLQEDSSESILSIVQLNKKLCESLSDQNHHFTADLLSSSSIEHEPSNEIQTISFQAKTFAKTFDALINLTKYENERKKVRKIKRKNFVQQDDHSSVLLPIKPLEEQVNLVA